MAIAMTNERFLFMVSTPTFNNSFANVLGRSIEMKKFLIKKSTKINYKSKKKIKVGHCVKKNNLFIIIKLKFEVTSSTRA